MGSSRKKGFFFLLKRFLALSCVSELESVMDGTKSFHFQRGVVGISKKSFFGKDLLTCGQHLGQMQVDIIHLNNFSYYWIKKTNETFSRQEKKKDRWDVCGGRLTATGARKSKWKYCSEQHYLCKWNSAKLHAGLAEHPVWKMIGKPPAKGEQAPEWGGNTEMRAT